MDQQSDDPTHDGTTGTGGTSGADGTPAAGDTGSKAEAGTGSGTGGTGAAAGEGKHQQTTALADAPGTRARTWSVLLPALTFLAGLGLAAAVLGATGADDEPDAAARPTPTPTPSASPAQPELVVTVPGPCLQSAERAEQAYALLEQGVTAARDLDARALADLVDQVQRERPQVEALVQACREAAGDAVVQPTPTG